ncbi:hypothetical protein KAH81_05015 [bacterium]|nr:hypothetical protein [bacterium]
MKIKELIFPIFAFILLSMACNFGDTRNIRMTVDGDEISAENAQIAISQIGSESFYVLLATKRPEIKIVWETRFKDIERWRGMKIRAKKFRAVYSNNNVSFEEPDLGIIVEITDVDGTFVSGKISGSVGVGAGTHRVSNGTFRAPASFWKR